MKLTYKQVQERLTSLISEMEQSLVEYLRAIGSMRVNVAKFDIEDIMNADDAYYDEFKLEFVELGDENNIILRGYHSEDYGYFTDQTWDNIEKIYKAVESL